MFVKHFLHIMLTLLGFAVTAWAQLPTVERVEPPNWWVGHSISNPRLLVRGANLEGASVTSKTRFLQVSNVSVNPAGDGIFLDLQIDSRRAAPGRYDLELTTRGGRTKIPFELSPPIAAADLSRGVNNSDIIYLIMTDRFADGDQANNKNVDRSNPRAWHGGDFRGVISRLDYLKELGISAIWLTPWYDNPDEENQCEKPWCPYTNYHGYHAVDYYAVENHFGTMADLRALVREARKRGIKVIQDQVANHVGVQHPWAKKPPLPNWFSPFEQNSFKNSVLLSPDSPRAERDNLLKGWFNELLPDLNQDEPEVSRYLIQNALWWVGMTGIDGIRQDTIQYMPRPFIRDWSAAIRKQYPKFYLVGEVFEENSAHTAFFQGGKTGWDGVDTKLPSVFDFKLWRTSQEVFTGKKPATALREVLRNDSLYPNINNVTVLANNHDTDRFMSLPGSTPEGAMMHTAFVLSVRGIPQLYYGEEIGITGGHDPENRKDFPGGFPGDSRDAFSRSGRTAEEQRMFEHTKQWIQQRRNPEFSEGEIYDLHCDEDTFVFIRSIPGHHGPNQTLVAINRASEVREIKIRHSTLRGGLVPVINGSLTAPARIDGEVNLRLSPRTASAYKIVVAPYFLRESLRTGN